MIHRHTKQQIDKYEQNRSINQSSLKSLLYDGVQEFIRNFDNLVSKEEDKLYYQEKEHFIIGTAVDDYICMSPEYYKDKYHFSTITKKPAPAIMSIIKTVFDRVLASELKNEEEAKEIFNLDHPVNINKELKYYEREIWEACNSNSFYMNRAKSSSAEDGRIATVLKDPNAQAYWEDLIPSIGKQILSEGERLTIENCYTNILNHAHTRRYFKDSEEVDLIYQMPLFFSIDNIECKARPDLIRVEHNNNMIRILDIKTMGDDILKFRHNIRRHRYDLQGSFYHTAVLNNLDKISNLIGKDISKYKTLNFAFIVESTTSPNTPLVFPMTNDLIAQGEFGSSLAQQAKGNNYKGWRQALYLYDKWSKAEWNIENRLQLVSGIVQVNDDFDYTLEL